MWDDFLKIAREEAGKHVVETWFKAAHIAAWSPQEQKVTLGVPNQFIKNWINDHYKELICTHLARLFHCQTLRCEIIVQSKKETSCTVMPASTLSKELNHTEHRTSKSSLVKTSRKGQITASQSRMLNIQKQYQFSNFIVGKSNALGHAAAMMVSKNLGKTYNPLILYGSTGLGKTHLMHAIANATHKENPRALICYQSADSFITEFIASIRSNQHQQFRDKYQKVDLLLLDDIQFLSNKEQTQEIFFHIFNRLHEQGKQIVISADSFPKDIVGLQHRLISRMEWGLVADIQMPDLETKIAILQKKAEEHIIELPYDVAQYIASVIVSNIRELEGALIRVSAYSALAQQEISVALAQQALAHCVNESQKNNITLASVITKVSDFFKLSTQEIKSKKRHKTVSVPRQIALYLMKKMTFSSLQTIGDFMGGRDHSTVIHAISKIGHLLETNAELVQTIQRLEKEILRQ
ncbi:chromosomal replication initiator protein DnaA [Candidatus Babeliales bacterium]|nr:chromosomal replication initiator protein DnaA [Candidatus Babeliales bacterium]